jgi:hypothetical protein
MRYIGARYSNWLATGAQCSSGSRLCTPATRVTNAISAKKPGQLNLASSA